MNKRQTVWLIVRFIGVCFIFWGILTLFGAFSDYFSSGSPTSVTNSNTNTMRVQTPTPQIVNPALPVPKSESQKAEDKMKSDALKSLAWQIFVALIYGAIGFYLIRNGKILFTTLIREDSIDETEEIVLSAPAKTRENVVTSLDLAPGSPSKKEEVTSLNLSEYVPKQQQTATPFVENAAPIEEQSAPIVGNTASIEQTPPAPVALPEIPPQIEQTEPVNQFEQDESVNQPFFADEQPTLIRQPETISEENPLELIEPPILEEPVKERIGKAEEPVSLIDEQPNETPAPSDVSADDPKSEQPA